MSNLNDSIKKGIQEKARMNFHINLFMSAIEAIHSYNGITKDEPLTAQDGQTIMRKNGFEFLFDSDFNLIGIYMP